MSMNGIPHESIVSARGLETGMRGFNVRMKYRVEINAPDRETEDIAYRWIPPTRETTDIEALELWINQLFLDNPTYTRDQVKIYTIEYTLKT